MDQNVTARGLLEELLLLLGLCADVSVLGRTFTAAWCTARRVCIRSVRRVLAGRVSRRHLTYSPLCPPSRARSSSSSTGAASSPKR
jgi:hypothetical protein